MSSSSQSTFAVLATQLAYVLVAGLIVGIYTHRLQDTFDSVDTSTLTVLKE